MVDKTNPSSQFHPYQPMREIPFSERQPSGLSRILESVGVNSGVIGSARKFVKSNPSLALGGLAALAIGLGLMRRRG